jgi:hypothetical protein
MARRNRGRTYRIDTSSIPRIGEGDRDGERNGIGSIEYRSSACTVVCVQWSQYHGPTIELKLDCGEHDRGRAMFSLHDLLSRIAIALRYQNRTLATSWADSILQQTIPNISAESRHIPEISLVE